MLPNKSFFTIDELVKEGFGSRMSIYRHIDRGDFPAIKLEGRIRIPRDALEVYCMEHRTDVSSIAG